MRKINWQKFKPDDRIKIDRIHFAYYRVFDENGRLYDPEYNPKHNKNHGPPPRVAKISDPQHKSLGIWCSISIMGGNWHNYFRDFLFTDEAYCFGWKNRLSSRAEHRKYFSSAPWFTIGDRDYIAANLKDPK